MAEDPFGTWIHGHGIVSRAWDRSLARVGGDPSGAMLIAMRSVADELHSLDRREIVTLSAGERIELALALGQRDLELVIARMGVFRTEAIRLLSLQRQAGRRASACMTDSLA